MSRKETVDSSSKSAHGLIEPNECILREAGSAGKHILYRPTFSKSGWMAMISVSSSYQPDGGIFVLYFLIDHTHAGEGE